MTTIPQSETVLQKRARLQREIDERHTELSAMENEISTTRLHHALTVIGKAGTILDVEQCDERCLHGMLVNAGGARNGYVLQTLIADEEFSGEHSSLYVDPPSDHPEGLRITLRADDGTLYLSLSHGMSPEHCTPHKREANLDRAFAYLRSYGIKMTTRTLCHRYNEKCAEVEELCQTILSVPALEVVSIGNT